MKESVKFLVTWAVFSLPIALVFIDDFVWTMIGFLWGVVMSGLAVAQAVMDNTRSDENDEIRWN